MPRPDKDLLLLALYNVIKFLLCPTIKNNVNINLFSKITLITQFSAFLQSLPQLFLFLILVFILDLAIRHKVQYQLVHRLRTSLSCDPQASHYQNI